MKNFLTNNGSILLILVFTLVALSIKLDKPFIGHHDWNGAFWGSLTRNYLNYFGLISQNSPDFVENVRFNDLYYQNYTPLLPLIFSLFSAILGITEFSLRFTSLIFSILLVYFIFKIGELLFDKKTGLLAAIFTSVTPMFLYFGKLPDHEPIVIALILISFYLYLKIRKSNNLNNLFLIFATFSLLESWPSFFFIIVLVIFSLSVRKDTLRKSYPLIAIGLLVITIHVGFLLTLKGQASVIGFFGQGIFRIISASESSAVSAFGLTEFLITESRYAVIYFTRALLILSIIWIIQLLVKIIRRKAIVSDWALLVLLVYPLLFVTVFRQLAFIHDYKLYHFLPFISLSASNVVSSVLGKIKTHTAKNKYLKIGYKYGGIFLICGLIIFTFTERLKFLNALLKTEASREGYETGTLLNKITSRKDKILILSGQFGSHFGVFTNFYSNRNIDYQDFNFENFIKLNLGQKYNYVVYVYNRDTPVTVLRYLKNNYSSVSTDKVAIFNIN